MQMRYRHGILGAALGAAALLAGGAALADVKAGVDAWTRGDYAAAVKEWAAPAKAGDADAQFNLAQAYRLGRGVESDSAKAAALYAAAAAQGHVKAADNYGLLLFQGGKREQALPYIQAAAGRGDPRAEYLLGIAHFNGDLVAKDWPRAYALLTLANAVGLPQAKAALQQMDEYIPLDQREQAQALAATLKAEADAARARDLAAVDLALGREAPAGPVVAARQAGADYTLVPSPDSAAETLARQAVIVAAAPAPAATAKPAAKPAPAPAPKPAPAPSATSPAAPLASGPWKVQLGAFGVPGNADRLWASLANRRELAGHPRIRATAGKLTVLYAGGFASQAAAEAACAGLRKSGQACLVSR